MALEDIAGYSLRRGLGSGAAGSVWLLRDLGSGRHAVLKRISAALVPAVEEFRRDLALTRSIDYPHVARLLDVRQTDREWLLISQYVAAGTLTNLLERREPLSLGELVTLISPLAQALAILHRAGLTHGNVTLDNVMFDAEGRPVLTDAGLRLLTAPKQTSSGATAPTPQPAAHDLAALADIAQASGGDPRIFTPDMFTGDGDEIAHRVLRLAAPEPINLGFGDDPPTSTPAQGPAGTTGSPPPHTAPAESQFPKSVLPEPSRAALGPEAAEDHAITSAGASAPSEGSGADLPDPTSDAEVLVAQPTCKGSLVGAEKPGGDAVTPTAEAAEQRAGVTRPREGVVDRRVGSRKARGRRRTAGRATRSRSRSRRLPVQGFRIRVISKLPAYGVLAMAGLAALIVLAFGLITVGVLGGPSSSSASAANNQPTASDATAPTDATPATPTPTGASANTPGHATTPASPATSRDSSAPATPTAPADTTMPSDPTGSGDPSAPRNTATPPGSVVPGGPSSSPASASAEAEASRWLQTLHALDAKRSRTFWTLDDAGLDAIYVRGSSPWKSDRSLLASYRDQQLRIEGLRIQIQSLAIEQSGPSTAVLQVVDRLVSATAVDKAGRRTPLPPGEPTARRITLKTAPPATTWRITEITTR